jgi:replication fork clamp-binding protein CrfC
VITGDPAGVQESPVSPAWEFFVYMDTNLARCEDVKKVEQRIETTGQKLDEKLDKSLKEMDFRFSKLELKTVEDRIYDAEKKYGSVPADPVKAAELNKLKRERETILRQMEEIKKK